MSHVVIGNPLVSIGKMAGGALTPEQYANVAVHKILSVSNNAHPIIREQANVFKERMHTVLSELFLKAMEDERERMLREVK